MKATGSKQKPHKPLFGYCIGNDIETFKMLPKHFCILFAASVAIRLHQLLDSVALTFRVKHSKQQQLDLAIALPLCV